MDKSDLTDIEMTLAHQTKQIDELSEIVQKQWDEIDRLKKMLSRADARITELEDVKADPNAIEKPPHY